MSRFILNIPLVLKNYCYIPNFTRNLISVGCLKRQGYYVSLDDSIFISMKNKIVLWMGIN